ncbi:MAG TPA: 3-oxoacyl-[acyl-carrier-protein] synthase III C-terminal domain-containing protein [Candidatus Binataceae bacterium]|nr:3-oxoacyl-[acyl-carrier-protein] synthase III C-terminal domain-containing protein [Candidatus Binataceae bacterium]
MSFESTALPRAAATPAPLVSATGVARLPHNAGAARPASAPAAEAPVILAAATALPPNPVDQRELAELLRGLWSAQYGEPRRWRSTFDQIQRSVRIDRRYLALPIGEYPALDSFAKTNTAWARVAPPLGAAAASSALDAAGLTARDVDHLFLVTGTGIATPSIDARIVNRLGMRADVRRTPIFGLGCAGGVAGVARAAELLRGLRDDVALVVSIELCSLTLQRDDATVANVIASALFGDGAAAVVVGGASRGGRGQDGLPRVVGTRAVFYPDSERMMGWDVVDGGLRIVLSPEIPALVRAHLGRDVDALLAAHGLERGAIRHWIAHTGGNRVLEAVGAALGLGPCALARSWRLLAATGNVSSASVLFVLRDLMGSGEARAGEWGVMLAMGPGFCAELALLRW